MIAIFSAWIISPHYTGWSPVLHAFEVDPETKSPRVEVADAAEPGLDMGSDLQLISRQWDPEYLHKLRGRRDTYALKFLKKIHKAMPDREYPEWARQYLEEGD